MNEKVLHIVYERKRGRNDAPIMDSVVYKETNRLADAVDQRIDDLNEVIAQLRARIEQLEQRTST